MPISFTCECGKSYSLRDELAGRKARCARCQREFVIPKLQVEDDLDLVPLDPQHGVATQPVSIPVTRPTSSKPLTSATSIPASGAVSQSYPLQDRMNARIAATGESGNLFPSRTSVFWHRLGYVIFAIMLLPLILSTFLDKPFNFEKEFEDTLQHHPDVQAKMQTMPDDSLTDDALFNLLPDHKLDHAFLSRDTYGHWLLAGLSSAVFTVMVLLVFPGAAGSIGRMILVGAFTGTIGIMLLLGFQYIANMSLGFTVHGRVGLLILIIKLIGWSYHSALDPDTNFLLSAVGFTFGVGLCEEICKALPILIHYQTKATWSWKTACVVGLISGVGFGVSEGITYSHDYYNGLMGMEIYFVRFMSCVALHAIWSGATAIFIFRQQSSIQNSEGMYMTFFWWVVLCSVSMTLHGFYDTLLKKDMQVWALVVAVLSIGWFAYQVESVRNEYGDERTTAAI